MKTIFKNISNKKEVNQPLPEPLVAYVTDEGHNPVQGANVLFSVIEGNGKFPDGTNQVAVPTDSDGRASAALTLGPKPGNDGNAVRASLVSAANLSVVFYATGLVQGDPGNTRISGIVLDNSNMPIPGVTLRVEDTTRQAVTDAQGQFVVQNVPVGPVHLIVDGSTAGTAQGIEYPVLGYDMVTVAGADNKLSMPVYLLPLEINNAATVGGHRTWSIPSPKCRDFL